MNRYISPARFLCILTTAILVTGCNPASEKTSETAVNHEPQLLAPHVPDTITVPERRAAFASLHFWDGLDITDSLAVDTAFMEQNFVNYITVLSYADTLACVRAAERLIDKSSGNAGTLRLIDFLAWKYLDEPNSPMRSEELYIFFLRRLSGGEGVPEEIALRSAERLKSALKNRPGSFAADIPLLSRDGGRTSLHALAAADTVLVVFYDPDCEHCRETTDRLAASEIPYPILAIDVIPDRQLWDDTKNSLPAHWQVAFATTAVEDRELYTFPALPSLYLLAPGARVILKDFTP